MASFSNRLLDEFAGNTLDLMRFAAGIEIDISVFLEELRVEIAARLSRADLTAAKRSALQGIMGSINSVIGTAYADMTLHVESMLAHLAFSETEFVRGLLNNTAGISLAPGVVSRGMLATIVSDSLVMGASMADWWDRFAGDTKLRAMQQLRFGVASGETTPAIVRRLIGTKDVPGVLVASRRNATALVRTAVQGIANSSMMATYEANGDVIKGYQQVSTLDNRTSLICIGYSGATWDKDYRPTGKTTLPFNGGCPRHWNCRSKIIPITVSYRDLGLNIDEIPPATRSSMDGQVADDITFDEWLRGKTEVEQNAQLGAGKAALWRSGKITLTDLLDQRGNPLTLAALTEKRARRFGSKR